MKFYPLKVKEIRKETKDCVSVSLEVPSDCKDAFAFTQGQYLTFKTNIDGKEIRRSYSICTSPSENDLRVAVKQVENGAFSTFANHILQVGDSLEVMPPMGHFYANINPDTHKKYLFIAAGSGITPIISNIKTLLESEPLCHITLLYGNQKVSTIIFKEELENLKNNYMERFQVFNILSREHTESELLNGRISSAKLEKIFRIIPSLAKADEYFICGPNEMIDEARKLISDLGIDEKNIHFEMFNVPVLKKKPEEIVTAVESSATITLDGLTLTVPIHKGQNILDAAQDFGMDMPYACKGGVCCTCRAKLVEGKVEMAANYALTSEEVNQGFILTCQAVPETTTVKIDFDIK